MSSNAIGWISIDKRGQILKSNQYFQELLEYDLKELQEKDIFEITFPDDLEITKSYFNELIEGTREFYRNEKRYIKKSGEIAWVKDTCCLVRDSVGNPDHGTCLVEDITERKQLEDELQKHKDNLGELFLQRTADLEKGNRLYRTTIDSIDHAIHVVDKELVILTFNKEFEHWMEKFGISSDIIGKNVRAAFPFLPESIEEEYRVVFKSGTPLITEEVIKIDSWEVITETRKLPVFAGNEVTRIVTSIQDITERKQMENALKYSEEKYRALIETSPNYIALVDANGNVIDCNNKISELFKMSIDAIKGENMETIQQILGMNNIYPIDLLKRALDENIAIITPINIMIKDYAGQPAWLEVKTIPLTIKDEKYLQIVGNDITEQKYAEQVVNEELEKLKTLDKLKTDFIYRASHELKTPLNAICSAAALLSNYMNNLNTEEKGLIGIISKGGDRLKHLVESMVESFRIEDDAMQVKKENIDLIGLIVDLFEQNKYFINQRKQVLVLDLPESVQLQADHEKLEFVFNNILLNAINNTPTGGTITVKAADFEDRVDISVSDTGVGFTEDEKARLFTKFGKIERYGQGLDIVTEGSGLGLYISKKAIELHGGTISVESAGRNCGSTFIVSLPKTIEE